MTNKPEHFAQCGAKLQKIFNMRKFLYIITCFFAIILLGCDNSSSTTAPSSVAKLNAFSFAKVDSMPGLAQAVFTVEERLDTGLVWNKDSMLYGTDLHRVVPRFVFAATPSASSLIFPDTVCLLTGYDTLDFTKTPIYLSIRSADKTNTKVYEIRPTVHQVDPDLYTWEKIFDGFGVAEDAEQRVVEQNGDFVMIVSNGFELKVYRSPDGSNWGPEEAPTGLPAGTKVRQIISDGETLYYAQEQTIYTSTDGIIWIATPVSEEVVTMLLYWNEEVWVLTQKEGWKYELATFDDEGLHLSGLKPMEEFPVSDFATICFQSPSGRERAMIIGGFAENGKSLNTRWHLEYSDHPLPNGQYRMEEFSIDRPQFTSMTGISVVWYNNRMLLFGGVDDKMSYFGRDILISTDEGLTWTKADSTKNQLPEVYQARQKQSAIVRDNNIYLFGGQDRNTTYSDVYRGRLNSIDW